MSIGAPPAGTTPSPATTRTPLLVQLAPWILTTIIIIGLIVLLALGKIQQSDGIGLLGVIIGGHGAIAAVKLT